MPFDFAGPSKRACDFALDLAAAVGASLSLVNVIERVNTTLTAAEHAAVVAVTRAELEHVARALRPRAPDVEALVVEDTPWDGIESAARDCNADLIVMALTVVEGSHVRSSGASRPASSGRRACPS